MLDIITGITPNGELTRIVQQLSFVQVVSQPRFSIAQLQIKRMFGSSSKAFNMASWHAPATGFLNYNFIGVSTRGVDLIVRLVCSPASSFSLYFCVHDWFVSLRQDLSIKKKEGRSPAALPSVFARVRGTPSRGDNNPHTHKHQAITRVLKQYKMFWRGSVEIDLLLALLKCGKQMLQ